MSALSFTKLFRSMLQSTLWVSQPHHVRIVWVTMMAMADHNGVVSSSIPGLASEAKVSLAEVEEALAVFLSPDKYSRTKDEEGKRIVEIDGGWQLINYAKYRAIQSAEQARELTRARVQRHRERNRNEALPSVTVTDVTVGNESASTSTSLSRSESDPDPEIASDEPSPSSEVAKEEAMAEEAPRVLKQTARDFASAYPTGGAPALKHEWDPDWLPVLAHQAVGIELGLTDQDIADRLFDCQHKAFPHGFRSEDHQFYRELKWAADEKTIRKAKEARSGANWEKPGHQRQSRG